MIKIDSVFIIIFFANEKQSKTIQHSEHRPKKCINTNDVIKTGILLKNI